MALQILLATAYETTASPASAILRFHAPGKAEPFAVQEMQFGHSAQVAAAVFNLKTFGGGHVLTPLPMHAGNVALPDDPQPTLFDLTATIVSGESVQFGITSLSSNDVLHVLAITPSRFLGSVFHGHGNFAMHVVVKKRCVLTCADGSSALDCISCTQNGITVKVCC